MRLSSKIILLAVVLLGFLGVNAFVSWQEIRRVQTEFSRVVQNDLALMKSATALNELQLKKEIVFEKLTSSTEELAFGNSNESRKQYLLDFIKDLHEQFKRHSVQAQEELESAMKLPVLAESLWPKFADVKKALKIYDEKVEAIFAAVSTTGYQLSIEDLDALETQQSDLRKNIQSTMAEVWTNVNGSIERINELQKRSQRVLWVTLLLSLMVALVLASAIIRRIHTALKSLVKGVRAVQQGKLGSTVVVKTSDEIGELAKAFNHMSQQLKEYQDDMQRKNVELGESLAITHEQKKELEAINGDLDRFVHLISHDIHGPIMAIIFYAEYLKKHAEGIDPKNKEAIEKLNDISRRLSQMVNDLLEMTRVTRSHQPFGRFDVGVVVKEVLQRQEFLIQKTGAVIQMPEEYPTILASPIKMSVVFFNLIGNAIKYSSKGQIPHVTITWERQGQNYVFGIKDNGIGIPKESAKEVFDVFKRLPNAKEFEGTGVGLAMVKDIIQEHGGRIWVEPATPAGSQFFFTIPLESPQRLS